MAVRKVLIKICHLDRHAVLGSQGEQQSYILRQHNEERGEEKKRERERERERERKRVRTRFNSKIITSFPFPLSSQPTAPNLSLPVTVGL
jgi:hypothetical protein